MTTKHRLGMALRALGLGAVIALSAMLPITKAEAATCAPATSQGTAPADYKNYCWLDFSSYNDTTARSVAGQAVVFNLPDGSTLSMTLRTTVQNGGTPAMVAIAEPSYSGAAFGNSAFFGIPGLPILYTAQGGGQVTLTMSNIVVLPPAGTTGSVNYAIIAADGESTNGGENLVFTTNGTPWTLLSMIANGTVYPTVAGVGTATVTETGVDGTVGSFVFGTPGNPTIVTASMKGSGLQGMALGLRYASLTLVSQISNFRVDPTDQFTYAVKTQAGTSIQSATTSGTALNGFTPISPVISAGYPLVLSEVMTSGSADTLANYVESLTCTNNNASSTTVLPNKVATTSYTTPALQYGDAVACVFTNTGYPPISGTAYLDVNHNGALDAGDGGPGAGSGINVKLAPFSGGACSTTATQTYAITATGSYTFPGVAYGAYCLTVTSNATLSNTTPYLPAGYIRTEAPTGIRQVTLTSGNTPPPQNFGFYNGTQLTATVFADTGISATGAAAGTANDGVKNAAEVGLDTLTVNAVNGGVIVGSGVTDGSGNVSIYLPASVSGAVTITPVPDAGYAPTGGNAGTSGGTYTRPSVTFTYAAGTTYSGLLFGLIPPPMYSTDGVKTVPAGTILYYPHTYVAGSAGTVALSLSAVNAPASVTGWSQLIYTDATCSGTIATGATQITAPVAMTANQKLCFLVKVFVPNNAPLNAQNTATITALFTYSGSAAPGTNTLTHVDTTTVGIAGAMQLSKQVKNVTTGGAFATSSNASPLDALQYQLTMTNAGTGAMATVVISDSTPAYTNFASAACPGTLPSGLTACSVTTVPAVGGQGALQWTFTGTLAPGASAAVTYNVTVAN